MQDKPKILIFSLAYHPFVGGAEVAIKEITERLGSSPSGGQVFVFEMITCNLDGKQKAVEQIGNIKVYRIGKGKLSKYFFPWTAYKYAKKLQAKNNYQIIWAMMANQAGWATMKFKKRFPDVKYLLTLQEGDSEWDIWIRTWFMRSIYKMIYRRADYIQVISNFLADRARKIGVKCEVGIVPNGVKIESQKSKVKSQNDNSKVKNIITVSRLVKKNGVEDLIKAIKILDRDNIVLKIIGKGKLENQLKQLVKKLNIEDRAKFLGEIENKEIYEQLQKADIFVRPSLSEGLGNAFLEAMTVKTPVIATPVGGIPDFLKDGETGWFCEVKNPDSIAEKINYILDSKNKDEVSRVVDNAYDLVIKKYNWNKVAIDMGCIFKELVN